MFFEYIVISNEGTLSPGFPLCSYGNRKRPFMFGMYEEKIRSGLDDRIRTVCGMNGRCEAIGAIVVYLFKLIHT